MRVQELTGGRVVAMMQVEALRATGGGAELRPVRRKPVIGQFSVHTKLDVLTEAARLQILV